nr:MAG TPA: hypothetical protein [Caudoviricetes sp.]
MPNCDDFFEHRHDFEKKEFSKPLKEQLPPDFNPSVVMGLNARVLTVHIDRFKSVDLGFIDLLEVESSVGHTILNATNPLALEWIAAVEYGIFGYPTRIEMNTYIPEQVRNVLHKLLTDKLVYEK